MGCYLEDRYTSFTLLLVLLRFIRSFYGAICVIVTIIACAV